MQRPYVIYLIPDRNRVPIETGFVVFKRISPYSGSRSASYGKSIFSSAFRADRNRGI